MTRQPNKTRKNTVKTRNRKPIARFVLGSFIFFILIGLFIGSVFRYSQIALLGQQLATLDQKIESLQAKRDSLKIALQAENRSDFALIAKEKLHMEESEKQTQSFTAIAQPVKTERSYLGTPLLGQLSTIVIGLLYQ